MYMAVSRSKPWLIWPTGLLSVTALPTSINAIRGGRPDVSIMNSPICKQRLEIWHASFKRNGLRKTHTHKHIQCVYQANIKWTKTKNPKQCQYKFQIKCRIKGKEQHDLKKITWIISSIYIETQIKNFNS